MKSPEAVGGKDNNGTAWDNLKKESLTQHKNEDNTTWKDLEKESFSERKFVKLEDLSPIFNVEGTRTLGHGTATSGNEHDVVESILTDGLRGYQSTDNMAVESPNFDETVGSTDLLTTTIPIYSSEEKHGADDMVKLKEELDHWEHRDAKNVILIRLPFKYLNTHTSDKEDQCAPFFIQKRDKTGQMRNYLDPRFIIGNYNRETGLVEMNEKFEDKMSDEFQEEMDRRLAKAEEESKSRYKSWHDDFFGKNDIPDKSNSEDSADDTWAIPDKNDSEDSINDVWDDNNW